MLKIGVLVNLRPNVGGSYQYWMTLLGALSQFHDEYDVFLIYENIEWKSIADNLGIKSVRYYRKKKGFCSLIIERLLWKYKSTFFRKGLCYLTYNFDDIKKIGLNVIFADSAMGIPELLKIRTIIPIHDLMHRYEKGVSEMEEGYDYRENLYKNEVTRADLILVDSKIGAKHVVESYGDICDGLSDKIAVLPFIAPPYIYADTKEKCPPVDLPEKYIFYPAQFWSHKNHIRLLNALAKLKNQEIIVNLVCVGSEQNNSGNIKSRLQSLNLLDQVYILEYVSNAEIVFLYKHARALVMPTLFGPTNIPPLEAFALGCPVITSGIYAIPEQLGDAAIYFNPRSEDEIAECIRRVWLDDKLCDDLIERGKKHVKQWGPEQFADTLKMILREHYE